MIRKFVKFVILTLVLMGLTGLRRLKKNHFCPILNFFEKIKFAAVILKQATKG
jgi:hypothetical protein